MPLNESQQRILKDWMHSKVVVQCPACGDNRWRFAEAAYVCSTPRRWEFGACGTKGGTCDIQGNCPLELAGQTWKRRRHVQP